jgi:hypothetical protein
MRFGLIVTSGFADTVSIVIAGLKLMKSQKIWKFVKKGAETMNRRTVLLFAGIPAMEVSTNSF